MDEMLNTHLSSYDYYLPKKLIAQFPVQQRDTSRLLVYDREKDEISHRHFSDLPEYLTENDILVLNDTKVFKNRLLGKRKGTGGKVEVFLLEPPTDVSLKAITKSGGKLVSGDIIFFDGNEIECEIIEILEAGERKVKFNCTSEELREFCSTNADVPLPPYISRKSGTLDTDEQNYQTVYAKRIGAVAAPTAGFHFTNELLIKLQDMGVQKAYVTLHVGRGTFEPVRENDLTNHKMHSEYYEITPEVAEKINSVRKNGGRIIPVGTTSVRVLETVADEYGVIQPGCGNTTIFIYPPYPYQACDALITNFHLPKSTLLMLVSALAGRQNIINMYEEAVREKYRFFSYGDAMLIK